MGGYYKTVKFTCFDLGLFLQNSDSAGNKKGDVFFTVLNWLWQPCFYSIKIIWYYMPLKNIQKGISWLIYRQKIRILEYGCIIEGVDVTLSTFGRKMKYKTN